MKLFFLGLLERHPAAGYVGAMVPTASGFWVLVENAAKLGAFLSICIGLAVGIVTFRVQRKNERIAEGVLAEQEKRRAREALELKR